MFESIFNTCVRSLPYFLRCFISLAFFFLSALSLKKSIKKTGISYSFYILSILSIALGIVYVAV